MQPKQALITGIGGFIGYHLAKSLLDKGIIVSGIALDSEPLNRLNGLDIRISRADIRDRQKIEQILSECKPDYVFHLAGILKNNKDAKSVETSCVDVNLTGTLNLLDACKGLKIESFIFSSTLDINGDNPIPYTESQNVRPLSPYALSKSLCEQVCTFYHHNFGLPVTILRLSLVYGPGQDNVMLIPIAINKILNNQELILYYNGLQTRDFIYVSDVVESMLAVVDCKKSAGKTIIICSATEYSLQDVAQKIQGILNLPAQIKFLPEKYRENDIIKHRGDNSLANEVLGWQPKFSLEQGLALTSEWYKSKLGE